MNLLLTSGGITNQSIEHALIELLGKPIAECRALIIPTAVYPLSIGATLAWQFVTGAWEDNRMTSLGWQSLGILELSALPSIGRERWLPRVEEADVFLVDGGDALYLAHWMRESGLAELLPSLHAVWVGLSAGSMVMTPRIGHDFVGWTPPSGGDETLGLVDFAIFPHLDHPDLPENTLTHAQRWAETMPIPAYAIDDQTAIRVVDGAVDVITEGHWTFFPR